jgi:plastocyanin
VTLCFSLVGCHKSGEVAETPACVAAEDLRAPTPPVGAAVVAIAVDAADDHFEPGCIVVAEGGEGTLVVRNSGRHPHNLTLPGGLRVGVDSGQVAFLNVPLTDLPQRFVCTIHPGMEGEIRAAA